MFEVENYTQASVLFVNWKTPTQKKPQQLQNRYVCLKFLKIRTTKIQLKNILLYLYICKPGKNLQYSQICKSEKKYFEV